MVHACSNAYSCVALFSHLFTTFCLWASSPHRWCTFCPFPTHGADTSPKEHGEYSSIEARLFVIEGVTSLLNCSCRVGFPTMLCMLSQGGSLFGFNTSTRTAIFGSFYLLDSVVCLQCVVNVTLS